MSTSNNPMQQYDTVQARKDRCAERLTNALTLVNALTQAKRDATEPDLRRALRNAVADLEFELDAYNDLCAELSIVRGAVWEAERFEEANGRPPIAD